MLNTIAIVGRVGRDPEVKSVGDDIVAEFTVAVERIARDADQPVVLDEAGKPKKPDPDWFSVSVWGKKADVARQYIKKGDLVGVSGPFKIDRWVDAKTGSDRSKPTVRGIRLFLLGGKSSGGSNAPSQDDYFDYDE